MPASSSPTLPPTASTVFTCTASTIRRSPWQPTTPSWAAGILGRESPLVSGYDIDSIDRSEVLRYLGYAGQPITTELDARIDDVVSRCIRIGRARGIWRIFDVAGAGTKDDGTPFVSLAGTSLELPGRSMEEHMAGAVAVGVMAVTVGMGVERELRRLSLTDYVEQVIFDAAATTLVERAADACEADVIDARPVAGCSATVASRPATATCPWRSSPSFSPPSTPRADWASRSRAPCS